MADNVANALILEHLKAMQQQLSELRDGQKDMSADIRGIKSHMAGMKSDMAGFMHSEVAQDSTVAVLRARLDRIERRLELSD